MKNTFLYGENELILTSDCSIFLFSFLKLVSIRNALTQERKLLVKPFHGFICFLYTILSNLQKSMFFMQTFSSILSGLALEIIGGS